MDLGSQPGLTRDLKNASTTIDASQTLQMCRYGALGGARLVTFCARVRCANVDLR
jgi:hypothetical protein